MALQPPANLDNFTYNISIDSCLQQRNAFWYSNSKITVLLTAYPDSIFMQSVTDSLGYFSVEIPGNEECYLKIEGAAGHNWGEKHWPLFIRNIRLRHSINLAFIPYLTNLLGPSEYVAVPAKRKFPFLKKRYQIIHEPPLIIDMYHPGMYAFSYGDFECVMDKSYDRSEIDFSVLIHDKARVNSLHTDSYYEFPGTDKAFQEFINRKRNSPTKVITDSVTFQVKIACVSFAGSLEYPIIVNPQDDWHNQEALRLFALLPRFNLSGGDRSRDSVLLPKTLEFNFSYPK